MYMNPRLLVHFVRISWILQFPREIVITQETPLLFSSFAWTCSVTTLGVTLSSLEGVCGHTQPQVARDLLPVPLNMSHIKPTDNAHTTRLCAAACRQRYGTLTPLHRDSALAHDSTTTITARTTARSAHS